MRFLDLPAELRNTIYDLVLADGATLEIHRRNVFDINYSSTRALTQVSKQIRAECLPVYYTSNIFILHSMFDCVSWLNVVGRDRRHLRSLLLGHGVLEGASWASPRAYPCNRVKVSCRIFTVNGLNVDVSKFVTEDHVVEEILENAKNILNVFVDATKDFGPLDITVSGTLYHCDHCRAGACFWCRHQPCCIKQAL